MDEKNCHENKSKSSGRLYESILQSIKEMIDKQMILPGERLPSERELAERFNVSRVPVREAIKILEYTGIIENRQGDGMYLRETASISNRIIRVDFEEQITSDVMVDLFEMRILLESKACSYAAQRRTTEDIDIMHESISGMQTLLTSLHTPTIQEPTPEQLEQMRTVSHRFHTAIVAAAHNVVLSNMYSSLFELLDVSKQLTILTTIHTHNSTLGHKYILDRIIARDGEGAERAMVEHLADAKERFLKTLREN